MPLALTVASGGPVLELLRVSGLDRLTVVDVAN
jgi:hypothetical protein